MRGVALLFFALASVLAFQGTFASEAIHDRNEDGMELRMMRNDIHDVYIEKGTVWLKLTPSAASEFEQLTHQRLGKSLDVYVDGIHATTFDVQAVITSGTLEIRSPPEALLEKLQNR